MFTTRSPVPALSDAVCLFWATARRASHWERVLPSPRPQLLIRRTRDRLSWVDDTRRDVGGAALGGPFAHPVAIDASQQDGTIGVVFQPGGLEAFGLPAAAVAGLYAPVEDVWPGLVPHLDPVRDRPLPAALEALERALLRLRTTATDRGVRRAMAALGAPGARVERVAADLGWSRRTLARRFTARVGLSPKAFARVQRFRGAIAALEPRGDLGEHALRWGYADQAHFNHDFRALSGMTPSGWRVAEHPYSTHVVVARPILPSGRSDRG